MKILLHCCYFRFLLLPPVLRLYSHPCYFYDDGYEDDYDYDCGSYHINNHNSSNNNNNNNNYYYYSTTTAATSATATTTTTTTTTATNYYYYDGHCNCDYNCNHNRSNINCCNYSAATTPAAAGAAAAACPSASIFTAKSTSAATATTCHVHKAYQVQGNCSIARMANINQEHHIAMTIANNTVLAISRGLRTVSRCGNRLPATRIQAFARGLLRFQDPGEVLPAEAKCLGPVRGMGVVPKALGRSERHCFEFLGFFLAFQY